MKLEWVEASRESSYGAKDTNLYLNGLLVYCANYNSAVGCPDARYKGWWIQSATGSGAFFPDGPFESEELAKSAAERAVKEWFRECLGEPVAYALMFGNAVICASPELAEAEAEKTHFDNDDPECASSRSIRPLYALEADE